MLPSRPHPRSPLRELHAAAAVSVERDGWQLPWVYSTPQRERAALYQGVGILDVSPFPKMSLRGGGVEAIAAALANGPALEQPGRTIQLGLPTYSLACRLTASHLFLWSADIEPDRLQASVDVLPRLSQIVRQDETSFYSGVAMLGPKLEPV